MMTYPFEYCKVQMQLIEKQPGRPTERHGFISVLSNTLKEKGPLGLYHGLSPWLLFSLPRNSLRFATYEWLTSRMCDGNPGVTAQAVCGAVAGAMEWGVAGTPMQNVSIKTLHDANSSLDARRYRGVFHAMRVIYQQEGIIRGFYSGIGPTVAKGMINSGIRFTTYTQLSKVIRGSREGGLGAGESMTAGFAAGLFSALVTQPIDTVKTNMQSLAPGAYRRSVFACFKELVRQDGVAGLYRGLGPRLCRVPLEQALLFMLYERYGRLVDEKLLPMN